MTRAELAELVERWRAILVPEWRIRLCDEPWSDAAEMDDYWAISQCHEDYADQKVHFPDASLERHPLDIETTVVHELLHALTRPWRDQVDSVRMALANDTAQVLRNQREHEEEQLVDRLARVLVAQAHGRRPFGTVLSESAKVPSSIAEWQQGAPLMVDAGDSRASGRPE